MRVVSNRVRGAAYLRRLHPDLSAKARLRVQWIDYYHGCGDARLTCRHFGISPPTLYRWLRRYDPRDLSSLEDRSSRPRQVRRPTWSPQLAQAVLDLREEFPRWGKDKLAILLRGRGWSVSTSMVGRILRDLRRRGLLREPPRSGVAVRRRTLQRVYATRKPKEYQARQPGDIVQVDTLDLRPLPGVILKQFTARDMVSRWDVLEVHRDRATARLAAGFLDAVIERTPFPIRAIQVDGGSEFAGDFEAACRQREIHLFVLPPRSPKLNGHVERANRTHAEEFWEVADLDWHVVALNRALRSWEAVYNTVRPHQSLAYRTPLAWLQEHENQKTDRDGAAAGPVSRVREVV